MIPTVSVLDIMLHFSSIVQNRFVNVNYARSKSQGTRVLFRQVMCFVQSILLNNAASSHSSRIAFAGSRCH
jgi:hypothetical protein